MTESMNKKRYLIPVIRVQSYGEELLAAGSPFTEGETTSGGGLHNDEVNEGLSRRSGGRHSIWGDDE